MKKLLLVRHGKSSWDLKVRDHDRVLLERGINDAHLIGCALSEMGLSYDAIWSSTAARALQTATIISEYVDYSLSNFQLKRELYTFDGDDLLQSIINCPNEVDTLMLFSHNHGLTDLVNKLGNQYFNNVPTTGVVIIEFNSDNWMDIKKGQTISHLFPKKLK
ncbi:SixA phosphatase family protein [Nonlabens sp.]|uniref:SixA phosphatase family protein n=1 Tax=Nonlabens sp. TaxID=1888209 RepID=UPI003F695EA3